MSKIAEVSPPRIDAVLLDAAGTLIQPAEPVAETYARIAREFGAEISPEALLSAFREVFGDMPPMAFEEFSSETLDALERSWWRTLVERVIAATGATVRDFDAFFEALYGHYATGVAWVLYPEVVEVLRSLAAGGYAVAVVSNFDSRLPIVLRDHKLESLLAEVVYSTGVGAAKPDSRIFHHALERLGTVPERAVHVGDSQEADYEGAKGAGLDGLLLIRSQPGQADSRAHVIGQLQDLLPWLEARR